MLRHVDKTLSRSNIYCAVWAGFNGMFCGDVPLRKFTPNPLKRFWNCMVDEYLCEKGT
jgi:hypothetical protein